MQPIIDKGFRRHLIYSWLSASLLLGLTANCRAQHFSRADLNRISLFATGHYQAGADGKTFEIRPLFPKRKDGLWLGRDKTDSLATGDVWHFYLQDDSTLILQLFHLKNGFLHPNGGPHISDLLPVEGCELYFRREKGPVYRGSTLGKDCPGAREGEDYRIRSLEISKDHLAWREQGFGGDDKALEGPPHSSEIIYQKATNKGK